MIKFSLKVSTWATLVQFAECSVPAAHQCSSTCELIKGEISSSEACAKSRKSLPRPKIGRVCQEGFDEAFKLTCSELCSLHGTSRAVPSHLGEACDKRRREVPRPIAHKACLDGFKAGLAATTALVNEKIGDMEEDARASLIRNNMVMLEEADTERSHSQEAAGAREVERTKQKEEEQERARKAVEEKSAEVRREKEALSKKQELEAARAAADIERQRKSLAEERQARIEAATDAKKVNGKGAFGSSLGPTSAVKSAPSTADAATREAPSRKTAEEWDKPAAGLDEGADETSGEDNSKEMIQMKNDENVEPTAADSGSTGWLLVRGDGKESKHVSDFHEEMTALIENSAGKKKKKGVFAAEHAETPNHSREPAQAVAVAAGKRPDSDSENKLASDIVSDSGYREAIKTEKSEGVRTQAADKDDAQLEQRNDNLVAATTAMAAKKEQEDMGSPSNSLAEPTTESSGLEVLSQAEHGVAGVETEIVLKDALEEIVSA